MAGVSVMGELKPYLRQEGNWWVLRYGFSPIGEGNLHIYTEHKFAFRPTNERIISILEGYNAENESKVDIDKIINAIIESGV